MKLFIFCAFPPRQFQKMSAAGSNGSRPEQPRPEHPRPDWIHRESGWAILNGEWKFAFDDEDVGIQQGWWKWTGEADSNQIFNRERRGTFQ